MHDFGRLAAAEHGLCVVATSRGDGSVQASVVNAGVMRDPGGDGDVVAFVARGGSAKVANLRIRPDVTVVARSAWAWAAVEGAARLVGPDDRVPGVDAERLRLLLREVFVAAGGTHDDWPAYDAVMAAERRVVVLVTPGRVYSNG